MAWTGRNPPGFAPMYVGLKEQVIAVSENVKIYEIARNVGISSGELLEICERAGFDDITHHSNAVSPERAEEIRKAAIRLYKPKQAPVIKPERKARKPKKKEAKAKAEEKAAAEKKAEPEKKMPSTRDVKPVPPPAPRGSAARAETVEEAEKEVQRRKQKKRRKETDSKPEKEKIRKRTIVFKQPKRPRPKKKRETKIEMTTPVTVRDLSERIGVPASEIIKELMFEHGVRASITQTIDDELVEMLGLSHDVEITLTEPKSAEDILLESLPEDKPEDLEPRPPVIALLGHVDHGKTTILDQIRHTHVAESEAGGITQDIAAWQVTADGQRLTFIDTPGHEAFTAMRARGAKITDVVILVVAADEGVMPQTVEAIDHARAAEVPIVVAVNKVDRPDANPMRVRQQLSSQDLVVEDWGGEVGCVDVSGLTGEGIDELLERVALEAEILEVKANPNRNASGAVLEARVEPGLGVMAEIIVQNGTLHTGDTLVCGNAFGSVRSMRNDRGEEIEEAAPGQPVAIAGLDTVPEAGEAFLVVDDQETARKVAGEREEQIRRRRLQSNRPKVTLENLYDRIQSGETQQLRIVLKGDVQGSLDPLVQSLNDLGNEEVSVRIIHSSVGDVTTSDVVLAEASDALIVAFRVREDEKVREMASARGVEVRHYDVIYDVIDEVRSALEGLLAPEKKEERLGVAEVRQTFSISRYGTIAGCYVLDGTIQRNGRVRVRRDGEVIHDGTMASLRQEKNDVRQVESGRECGINIQGFNNVQVGDVIECYQVVTVKRTLSATQAGERSGS
jgi:translation initiation factor IF-2